MIVDDSETIEHGESVEQLLAQIRILRRVIFSMFAACCVIAVVLFVKSRQVPDEVRARGFVLEGENGERAAEWVTDSDGQVVRLALFRGAEPGIELSVDPERTLLRLTQAYEGRPQTSPGYSRIEFSVGSEEASATFSMGDVALMRLAATRNETSGLWQYKNPSARNGSDTVSESSVSINANAKGATISTYPKDVEP